MKTLILHLSDFWEEFFIENDVFGEDMGVVLTQGGRPIAYFRKQFPPAISKISAYVQEMVIVIEAVKWWRYYLVGAQFTIVTDHDSLMNSLTQNLRATSTELYIGRVSST